MCEIVRVCFMHERVCENELHIKKGTKVVRDLRQYHMIHPVYQVAFTCFAVSPQVCFLSSPFGDRNVHYVQ